MGFSFPKELREALVESDPEKFSLPDASNMRFNWVDVRLETINLEEMQEIVVDAWSTVVPKSSLRSTRPRTPSDGASL